MSAAIKRVESQTSAEVVVAVRKQAGVSARFVIMFAKDTLEDPTQRVERDGFLDEIERISNATGVFDGHRFAALDAFLAAPGPDEDPPDQKPVFQGVRHAPVHEASAWL